MSRCRRAGFTLIELLATVTIIFVLAAMLMVGAQKAQERARVDRSNAWLDVLATACEDYWANYHDWPMPNPDVMPLGTIGAFRAEYYDGTNGWNAEGVNVALVWLLSRPRNPEPYVAVEKPLFKKTDKDIKGPKGETLYRAVDGFQNLIRIERYCIDDPTNRWYSYASSYIKLISAGADGDFDKVKDNLERYLKR